MRELQGAVSSRHTLARSPQIATCISPRSLQLERRRRRKRCAFREEEEAIREEEEEEEVRHTLALSPQIATCICLALAAACGV